MYGFKIRGLKILDKLLDYKVLGLFLRLVFGDLEEGVVSIFWHEN